jgi:putative peptidoglycan lipid II flippase
MLSKALKAEDRAEVTKLIGLSFETGLMLSLPAAIGLIVVAGEIMSVLFEHGEFTRDNSIQSSHALIAYSIGLPAYVLSRVFSTAYFAREDTKTPVKFTITCAIINTALALAFITPLRHVGIALATGITAWVNLALLMRGLHKKKHLDLPLNSVKRSGLILVAGLIMAGVLWGLSHFVLNVFSGGMWHKVLDLGILIGAAGISYFGSLFAFGIFTRQSLKALFPKRKKQDTIETVQRIEGQ